MNGLYCYSELDTIPAPRRHPVAQRDSQLRPADEKAGDNNGRNIVRPQTQEPYGDQELAAESQVHFHHHFAGQPLETVADREANEQLRAERYARAKVDPLFRRQAKIDVPEDEIEVHLRDVVVPIVGDPNALPVDGEDADDLSADDVNAAEQDYEHRLDDGEVEEA